MQLPLLSLSSYWVLYGTAPHLILLPVPSSHGFFLPTLPYLFIPSYLQAPLMHGGRLSLIGRIKINCCSFQAQDVLSQYSSCTPCYKVMPRFLRDLTLDPSSPGEVRFSPWMHPNCNFLHFFFLSLNVTPRLDTARPYIDLSHVRCVLCSPTHPTSKASDLHKWRFVRLVFCLPDS